MKVNKRVAVTFILAIIIVAILGYRFGNITVSSVADSDNSILTKQPCSLPCWYGLIPGKSSLETLRATLADIPLLSGADLADERTINDVFYVWRGHRGSSFNGVKFSFKNDTLYSIDVAPNISYTLQDILNNYGTPSGLRLNYDTGSPEMLRAFVDIDLFYPTSGLIVTINIYSGKLGKSSYEILPESQGKQFRIFPASQTLKQLVAYEGNTNLDAAGAAIFTQFKTEWPGLNSFIYDPFIPGFGQPPVTPNIQSQQPTAIPTP
jgi:hypothetical protein